MKQRIPLFKTIAMDPPWLEQGGGKIKRGADRHYSLIKTKDMPQVILHSGVWNPDPSGCHLYMWVTNNKLEDGLWLGKRLGFKYKTNLCWPKDSFGIGQYFRGQHELCLFFTKGPYMPTRSNSISTRIDGQKTIHSRKPDEFYIMAAIQSPGPRLDMFARELHEGWIPWGLEAPGREIDL